MLERWTVGTFAVRNNKLERPGLTACRLQLMAYSYPATVYTKSDALFRPIPEGIGLSFFDAASRLSAGWGAGPPPARSPARLPQPLPAHLGGLSDAARRVLSRNSAGII
jgi:hypothetical protein